MDIDISREKASMAATLVVTLTPGNSDIEIVPSSDVSQTQTLTENGHSSSSTVKDDTPFPTDAGPPPLPYNLREHKLTITIFWFLIFTECTLIPIIFYFTIVNLTNLREGAMFAIITAMFGFISGGEYGLRGLRLLQKSDKYRPLNGSGRWHFDSTHIILGQPYFVMTALMIGFSIPDPPLIRGLSIIMPVGMIMISLYMIWTGIAHHFHWRLRRHRLSSHVVGSVYPPLTFCIMEDIVGCDGGGGRVYREAVMARYNASPRFRRMLVQMLWAWAISGLLIGVILIVLAWMIAPEVAYALGWGVPSLWGGVGAFATIQWGQRCLRIEKERWYEDRACGVLLSL